MMIRHVFRIFALSFMLAMFATHWTDIVFAQSSIPLNDLAWNADGSLLAIARTDGTVTVLNASGQVVANSQIANRNDGITSASWSPVQNNRLAISTYMGQVKIVEFNAKQQSIGTVQVSLNYVRKVSWNSAGTRLAVAGEVGAGKDSVHAVKVWDAKAQAITATFERNYSIVDIAWHPLSSEKLLITTVEDGYGAEIMLWNVQTNTIVWNVQEPEAGVITVSWSHSGDQFASATVDWSGAKVRIHDAINGNASAPLATGITSALASIAWNPNQELAVSGLKPEEEKSIVQVWDPINMQLVQNAEFADSVKIVIWHPQGELTVGYDHGGTTIASGIEGSEAISATSTPGNTPSISTLTPTRDG